MDPIEGSWPSFGDSMGMKRKREPWDYREYFPSVYSSRKRRKSVADYNKCSAQQRDIFQQNAISSPLLRLPPEIRNEIYAYVLSNNVVHISVRECPIYDRCSWSHSDYYRKKNRSYRSSIDEKLSFLKFTHTLCTLPFDEENRAHALAIARNNTQRSNLNQTTADGMKRSYRIRHKPCYRALARLKGNWIREDHNVTISPWYKPASTPGLSVSFVQTCRQVYTESRDLVYTSNTFAFHEGHTLDLFLSKCLLPSQRSIISSIQLDGWNGEDFDPGCAARAATLQNLTGLKSCVVAVTNAQFQLHSMRHRKENATEQESESGEAHGDVVKVTVDRLASGWVDCLDLESTVKKHAETALGLVKTAPKEDFTDREVVLVRTWNGVRSNEAVV